VSGGGQEPDVVRVVFVREHRPRWFDDIGGDARAAVCEGLRAQARGLRMAASAATSPLASLLLKQGKRAARRREAEAWEQKATALDAAADELEGKNHHG
jgi:hypothetical protein